MIFSCPWGATHSRIDDLFICPQILFKIFLFVGYTLFMNLAKTFGINLFSLKKPNVSFVMRSSKEVHAILVFYFTCQNIRQKSKFF